MVNLISKVSYLLGWGVRVRGSEGGGGWLRILKSSATTCKLSISIDCSRYNRGVENDMERKFDDIRTLQRKNVV
jgi:hypothetical protein